MNLNTSLLTLLIIAFVCPATLAHCQQNGPAKNATVTIAGQPVSLSEPILPGGLDADSQRKLIEGQLRGMRFSQFTRDSIVAPVRIDLQYIKNAAGERVGHQVHVLFVAHETLERFASDQFSDLLIGESAEEDAEHNQPVPAETLRSMGVDQVGENTHYRRLRFELLDKVRLDLMIRLQQTMSTGQNRIDIELVDAFENRWQSIESGPNSDRDSSVDSETDPGGPYSGMAGWLTATSLSGLDAVLIEARFVLHEPTGWFRGDNFLRSKLPIVLQEAARDLRRHLKKQRE